MLMVWTVAAACSSGDDAATTSTEDARARGAHDLEDSPRTRLREGLPIELLADLSYEAAESHADF